MCHDFMSVVVFSRSRRQLVAALNKECQFGFTADSVEESADLDAAIAYYQLDDTGDTVFPPLPVRKPKLPNPMIQKHESIYRLDL